MRRPQGLDVVREHELRVRGEVGHRTVTSLEARAVGPRDDIPVEADGELFRTLMLEPALPSEGVEYVITNGKLAIDRGRPTGSLEGRILKRR